MQLQEDFITIRDSETFKEFLNSTYLISCFLDDIESKKRWEYNFYQEANKEILSFSVENAAIVFSGKSPPVNPQHFPQILPLEELKSEQEDIFNAMRREFLKEYTQDKVLKIFTILEKHEDIVWSFLILLKNLNVIHMKINDRTQEDIENSSISMIKKEKGGN